jgi:hypothetical protein
MSEDLSPNIKI